MASGILRLVLALAALYVLVTVLGHFVSLGMIFPRPPANYQMTPEYVTLATPDGVKLAARLWANPQAKYTMLYLHGNYEDLGSIDEYMPQFLKAGYAVFAFDYRHYGHSEGTPTEANTCADARLAYDYVRTKLGVPADRILIFGYSLGSGPAVELALHEPAAGLVLHGAFVSAYRVRTHWAIFPGDKFENLKKVPRLRLPVMVIHGMADGTVPFWHGEALFQAITARKAKLFVEGGPHTGLPEYTELPEYTGKRYWDELRKFSDSL
jgi:fermentation-respiration switch protein FrsA (DUF1100 family)